MKNSQKKKKLSETKCLDQDKNCNEISFTNVKQKAPECEKYNTKSIKIRKKLKNRRVIS